MQTQTISDILYKSLYFIIAIATMIIVGSFFMANPPFKYAETAGQLAIRLLWIVATPGILKRFRVTGILQKIQIVLMRSRRRLGILTFLLMAMHALWIRLILDMREGFANFFPSLTQFELIGLIGFCLLIPLFITSNNYSVKLLKKNWTRIHTLIYASMWLIAFHVALQGSWDYALPTFTIAILQAVSWIYFIATMPKTTQPTPVVNSISSTAPDARSAGDQNQ